MLTVDDANTIIKKYGESGFWYEVDFNKLELGSGKRYTYDFYSVYLPASGGPQIIINDSLWQGQYYFKNSNGEIINATINGKSGSTYILDFKGNTDVIMCFFISNTPVDSSYNYFVNYMFIPRTELVVPVVNGEFEEKFYINYVGNWDPTGFHINNNVVELEEDENGTFLRFPSATDSMIGPITGNGTKLKMYKVTFREFKTLPIPYIPTLYKGTPQNVQVLNSEDDDPISDYQTYYQGRLLKDNIIHLPYDSEDYVNISVDLKDYRYPFATVKLKAPTVIYQANSQSDVELAIENGIQTLQIGDNETEVTLNAIELSNVTLINSNIQVSESILTDCQIIDSAYTDNGGNNITDTTYNNVTITSTETSTTYNDCILDDCTVTDAELHITGTLTNNTFNNTLIISDGIIATDNNIFNGVGSKTYFPSHLYLTGEFTLNNNTFNLTGEWTELQYNMCLIKATSNFNPSEFINKNTFNLNITYEDEPTNTFYYNIVDDDKIRAVRL